MSRKISILVIDYPPREVNRVEVNHFEVGETVQTCKGKGVITGTQEQGWYIKNEGYADMVLYGNPEYERYPVKIGEEILWFYRKDISD